MQKLRKRKAKAKRWRSKERSSKKGSSKEKRREVVRRKGGKVVRSKGRERACEFRSLTTSMRLLIMTYLKLISSGSKK